MSTVPFIGSRLSLGSITQFSSNIARFRITACCFVLCAMIMMGMTIIKDNRVPTSHEIIMFVCLWNDAEQYCEVIVINTNHCCDCSSLWRGTSIKIPGDLGALWCCHLNGLASSFQGQRGPLTTKALFCTSGGGVQRDHSSPKVAVSAYSLRA